MQTKPNKRYPLETSKQRDRHTDRQQQVVVNDVTHVSMTFAPRVRTVGGPSGSSNSLKASINRRGPAERRSRRSTSADYK